MLSKKTKDLFTKQVIELSKESKESSLFHSRIEREIKETEQKMKKRRENFRFIQNK